MLHLATFIQSRFVRDERGVTAIEYALLAGLVAVALIAGATLLGLALNTTFTDISNDF